MSRKRTERSRWTQVFILPRPMNHENLAEAQQRHSQLCAVVEAFDAVGRVIRIEPAQYGEALVFKARKS